MVKLNGDILYLIFKELQSNKKTLLSCLTVNKTCCEIIIPILWNNPWKYLKGEELLLNVIISHFSEESKNNLKNQGINFSTNAYQRPLFNYISFCRHLNIINLNHTIDYILLIKYVNQFTTSTIKNLIMKEIINLFVNQNTRITHLYIPSQFSYQINIIPGAKYCFSELEFLSCNSYINDNILIGLTEICNSIKELELFIEKNNNNCEIVKLIESVKKLINVRLITEQNLKHHDISSFCKILENSLVKHANTLKHFKITEQPTTKILSSFVNLNRLELSNHSFNLSSWNCLENLSLPFLQILIAKNVPIDVLTSLIKNTNGYLIEVKIDGRIHYEIENKEIIQVITQNCPNLKYLKLMIRNCNILELEKLLINCQHLNGLIIIINNDDIFFDDSSFFDIRYDIEFKWDDLFEILTRSSPTSLFKFKFYFYEIFKLKSLKLFLDNWKNRNSMLLQTIQNYNWVNTVIGGDYFDLVEEYKTQGIIKKYDHFIYKSSFEDFEWI
jgi:hypothetical protein